MVSLHGLQRMKKKREERRKRYKRPKKQKHKRDRREEYARGQKPNIHLNHKLKKKCFRKSGKNICPCCCYMSAPHFGKMFSGTRGVEDYRRTHVKAWTI